MRIYPPVTTQEAESWLSAQAVAMVGAEAATTMQAQIATLAEALAAISAVQLPEDLEPLLP
jgi:hypothetical protein